MIGRNCPFASEANGFWKSPTKNAPSEPAPDEVDIFETSARFAPAVWAALAIEGLSR